MPELYLCGHGSIMDGSFTVPDKTYVYFYCELGDELGEDVMRQVLSGPPNRPDPIRAFGPGTQCPKVKLYPIMDDGTQKLLRESIGQVVHGEKDGSGNIVSHGSNVNTLAVGKITTLEDILTRYRGAEIHWVACTS